MTSSGRTEASRRESAVGQPLGEPAPQPDAEVASLRAENTRLREQLGLRDHALDSTATFFVIAKLAGRQSVVVYCNKAVADQLGVRRDEVIGQPVSVLARWVGHNPNYIRDVYVALRAGKAFRYEDQVLRMDGSTFWLGISIMPLCDTTGRLTHAVTVGADITAKRDEALKKQILQDTLVEEMRERARMGIELQTAQKLESVGRLAAGIAHEINTPTQFIANNIGFLKAAVTDVLGLMDQISVSVGRCTDDSDLSVALAAMLKAVDVTYLREEVPRAIEQSMEGVERIKTIVGAMKDFSHPAVEITPTDINRAINSTIIVASNEWKYVADIETEFDADLPSIPVMPGLFNQVVLNMIVNAAHAIADGNQPGAPAKGVIAISTRYMDGWAEIRIRDTGCGIPEAIRDRIFDPFFTTKPIGKGTGQGLAIAHDAIVNKHGGTIAVESGPGQGTVFILRLPHGRQRLDIVAAA